MAVIPGKALASISTPRSVLYRVRSSGPDFRSCRKSGPDFRDNPKDD